MVQGGGIYAIPGGILEMRREIWETGVPGNKVEYQEEKQTTFQNVSGNRVWHLELKINSDQRILDGEHRGTS